MFKHTECKQIPSTMNDSLQFETPENVHVRYTPAGLGTRFLAWFVDQIFVSLTIFCTIILLACAGVSFTVVDDFLQESFDPDTMPPEKLGLYIIGFIAVLVGLGSFVYFTLCELFLQGQTPGKKMTKIRVVKADGFALDAGSVLVRNIFRIVDHIPLMWVFPVMSKRSQRAGDLVAGTVVISDELPEISEVRTQLADRQAVEAEFRFDARALSRLPPQDIEAIEKLLDRWHGIPAQQREALARKLVDSLVAKLQVSPPPENRQARFLEDLLAAEVRRQSRLLG